MIELFHDAPLVFVAVAFAYALMIGSFLNVVIYRLPIMMQREWRDQCKELQKELPEDLPEGRFNLVVPRSRCPACHAASFTCRSIRFITTTLQSRPDPTR